MIMWNRTQNHPQKLGKIQTTSTNGACDFPCLTLPLKTPRNRAHDRQKWICDRLAPTKAHWVDHGTKMHKGSHLQLHLTNDDEFKIVWTISVSSLALYSDEISSSFRVGLTPCIQPWLLVYVWIACLSIMEVVCVVWSHTKGHGQFSL